MKQKIIFTTIIALGLFNQLVTAASITDTYATGDTLTATKMDNIKSAVNDNDARVTNLDTNVTNLQQQAILPGPVPKIDIPAAEVKALGWEICHSEPYDGSGVEIIADILTTCSKANLMLACRPVGNANFTLAAHAPRADVTFDTTNDLTTTHNANGTEWYFNESYSWGFAIGGDIVNKNSCDTGGANPEYRMCLHTSAGDVRSGYRCGITKTTSATWESVILHKD